MKTKFILHGGFTSTRNEFNRSFYEEIGRDVSDGGTILLIYFSRKEEDVESCFKQDSERILEQSNGKGFTILLATEEHFIDQLKKSDALYMRGGNTDRLLTVLKKFPDFKNLIKGKTVAGSSAGAYVIGTYGAGHTVENIREGLGLLPIRTICHYESSELPPTEKSVEILKNTASELELVLLRDHEWKMFTV